MQRPRHPLLLTCLSSALLGCGAPGEAPERAPAPTSPPLPARADEPAAVERSEPAPPSPAVPPPVSSPPVGPLTLEAAIARALSENPDLRMARARIDAAAAQLEQVRGAFRPYLGVEAEYLGADAPSTYLFKTIDAGVFEAGTDFNDPGSFDNLELGLALRWNLYNGGRDLARRDMAEQSVGIRALEAEAARNALVTGVVATWYDVRAAAEQERTARASAETVRAQLEETRARHEAGVVLESDVLSLEVRAAEADELVIRAGNARALALAALANLLGETGELELAAHDPPPTLLPEEYAAALDIALAERPELERARAARDRAARGIDEARAGYLPRADLFARLYGDSPDGLEFERGNWIAGVALTWGVYAGGSRAAGVEEARAGLRQMLEADRAATLAVQLDVKRAWLRRDEARARLQVAGTAVGQAEASLRLVREQYEGGVATVTRYLEAELMTTQARMRVTQARYDLRKAEAELERALGRHCEPTEDEA